MAIKDLKTLIAGIFAFAVITPALANSDTSFRLPPNIVFQIGGFDAYQGTPQHIGISGLIGDQFTITHHNDQNLLLGLGYFVDGFQKNELSLMYGVNAFYLAQTFVKGDVIQEDLFTNLSYRYRVTNYPIYAALKGIIHTDTKYNITWDLGIGPNIIATRDFSEKSLDGGITIPDRAFTSYTKAVFSATAGFGIKFNNVLGCMPLEIGYRYFYLGQGSLKKETNQLQNHLHTGNSYANGLVISISS